LPQRALRTIAAYLGAFLILIVLLQVFTPLPALAWLVDALKRTAGF
jgi:hypothetical protein